MKKRDQEKWEPVFRFDHATNKALKRDQEKWVLRQAHDEAGFPVPDREGGRDFG